MNHADGAWFGRRMPCRHGALVRPASDVTLRIGSHRVQVPPEDGLGGESTSREWSWGVKGHPQDGPGPLGDELDGLLGTLKMSGVTKRKPNLTLRWESPRNRGLSVSDTQSMDCEQALEASKHCQCSACSF